MFYKRVDFYHCFDYNSKKVEIREGYAIKPYYEIMHELRVERGLKQCDLAKALNITQQVYSRYENGINSLPIRHLITLCKFYNISADVLLDLKDE